MALEQIYPVVSKYRVVESREFAKVERNYPGQPVGYSTSSPNCSKNFANWTNSVPYQIHRVSQPQSNSSHNQLVNNVGTNGHRVMSISQSVLIAKRQNSTAAAQVVEIDSDDEFEDY